MLKYFAAVLLTFACCIQVNADEAHREQVGEVLGKPVYRDQLMSPKGYYRGSDTLMNVFVSPLWARFREQNADTLKVSEKEINAFVTYFQRRFEEELSAEKRQLKVIEKNRADPAISEDERRKLDREKSKAESRISRIADEQMDDNPRIGRSSAIFVISHWKRQHLLYTKYGGGAVQWQQIGVEATDAMEKWVEACEANGEFKITDPIVKKMLYDSFSTNVREEASEEFLRPEWRKLLDEKPVPAKAP